LYVPEVGVHARRNSRCARTIPAVGSGAGRVAAIEVAGLVPGVEPLLALRGRTVSPLLGHDLTLGLLLDAVVADSGGGVERLRDLGVRWLLEVAGVRRVLRPNTREAIGLELDADGLRVRSGLQEQSELVLHVVAVLVRDDISLGEGAALRAEPRVQLLEEADVEVNLLVIGAIEGTHRSLREPARALRRTSEQHSLRGQIGLAAARELIAPVFLDAVDKADDAAIVSLVGVRAGLAFLHRWRAAHRRGCAGVVGQRIHAEKERHDEDDQAEPAAANDDRTTHATAESTAPALVFYLRRIELLIPAECHVRTQRN